MKVRVSSYQSIASAEIEAVGFTTVTGHSNIGKSALLRAIAAALFGQEGDHFVRKGQAACAVTVEHDGHVIEWQKVRKKKQGLENCVILDGEKFTRLGKGHGDLIGPLGYQTIKAGGELTRPQYATQYDDIFLLTATPNTAAEVFKMLGRVDVVTRAQEAAKQDLRKAASERVIREGDSTAAFEALSQLGWVAAFEEWYKQLCEHVAELKLQEAPRWTALEQIHLLLYVVGEPRDLPAEPVLPDPGLAAGLLELVDEFEAVAPRGELPVAPELIELERGALVAGQALKRIEEYARFEYDSQVLASERGESERAVLSAEMRKGALEEELGACPTCQREFEPGALELGAAARDCERCKPRVQP